MDRSAMVRLRQPVTSIEGPSRHRRDPLLAPSGEQVQQGADRSLSATQDMKWTFESFYRLPRRIPFPGRCPRRPENRQRWRSRGRGAGRSLVLRDDHFRKSRMLSAISRACVSSAKWPVSKKRTSARGISRLNASAPGGRKNGSFLPHTAKSGGLCVLFLE
jgi:hypothetical protein